MMRSDYRGFRTWNGMDGLRPNKRLPWRKLICKNKENSKRGIVTPSDIRLSLHHKRYFRKKGGRNPSVENTQDNKALCTSWSDSEQ